METRKKRIAIVGCGPGGVASIVQIKQENMEPVCFEKTSDFGGTWLYREKSVVGSASIMPTTIINHSKEMGAVSNFPPKKEYSNYMRHDEVYAYMKEYVEMHDCLKHVQFNTEVLSVKQNYDYEETGRWSVTVKNVLDGSVSEEIFDGVMVCTGMFNYPKMPQYPGQETFTGKIMHTHDLKHADGFKGQNVVVVGSGCSAMDAATEASSFAKKVYLSTRSGSYVFSRVGPNGYPIDVLLLRRWVVFLLDISMWLCNFLVEKLLIDPVFHHKFYAVKPKYHILSRQPVFGGLLPSKLVSGTVVQVRNIDHFTENGVVFENDDHVTKADTVIMATGYKLQFPFIEDGIIINENGKINLYECVFPSHLKHPTFAMVGIILPLGSGVPLGELQCRWIARVFSGKCNLPTEEEMKKSITKHFLKNLKRYVPSDVVSLHVDYVQYQDQIATKIGAKPNFLKIFFTDNRLFWKLLLGPSMPYQYRLQGPHQWEGARQAIFEVNHRIHYPFEKKN